MNNFLLGQDLVMKKVPRIFYQILLALSPVDNIKGMIKYREKRKEPIVCLIKAKIGTTCVFSMAFNDKKRLDFDILLRFSSQNVQCFQIR